jgi:hypothetical protein
VTGAARAATTAAALAVVAERDRQRSLGYTPAHDDEHGLAHLLDEAAHRVRGARHIVVGGPAGTRKRILEAAAVLVAALEHLDRAGES